MCAPAPSGPLEGALPARPAEGELQAGSGKRRRLENSLYHV